MNAATAFEHRHGTVATEAYHDTLVSASRLSISPERHMKRLHWILVAGTLLTLCESGLAQTRLTDVSANFADCSQATTNPFGSRVECSRPLGNSMANAVADPGHLGVMGSSATSTGAFAATSGARANFEDFFVLSGLGTGLIPVSMNFNLNGQLLVPFSTGTATAGVKVFASINGIEVGKLTARNGGDGAECLLSSFGGVTCDGTTVSGSLLTQTVLVPLNTPVLFFFELEILTSAFNVGESAFADFSHSLDLPLAGPVFNLPDGVTANSPTSFIVDNRFTPPLAVPEPGTVTLIALGLAALARRARRPYAASSSGIGI